MSTTPVTPDPSQVAAAPAAPPSGGNGGGQPPAPPQISNPSPAQPTSRLGAILGAVARTVSTGLQGIPESKRPGFVSGLGEGARSEKAAEATQQAIKFKTFDDQVRAAQLHNEDLRMQNATDDHQNTVQDRSDKEAQRMTDTTGMTYTKVPNTSADVITHMTADQAQNGGASVSPGTIMGPHAMYIPNKGSAEQAQALTKDYNWRAPAYGLGSVQPGTVVKPGAYDQLRQASNGLDNQGHPMSASDVGNRVDNLTSYLKANQGLPAEAKNAIQSDIDHLTDLQTHHAARDQAGIQQATAAAGAKAEAVAKGKAAGTPPKPVKPDTNMYVGTDATGNQIAGTSDDLQKAGAQGVTKLDGDSQKKVFVARQLTSPEGLFYLIRQDMDSLDKNGKLGSTATSRFNEALLSKGGSDPDYAPLFVHTHLLATALMQAHVGSRGSIDMMEEFKKLADSGKMSAATLRSSLAAEYKYVHEKAMLPKAGTQ